MVTSTCHALRRLPREHLEPLISLTPPHHLSLSLSFFLPTTMQAHLSLAEFRGLMICGVFFLALIFFWSYAFVPWCRGEVRSVSFSFDGRFLAMSMTTNSLEFVSFPLAAFFFFWRGVCTFCTRASGSGLRPHTATGSCMSAQKKHSLMFGFSRFFLFSWFVFSRVVFFLL